MVSQKQISSWLPTTIELFSQYISGLDTKAILFQIVSPKTAEKTRVKIVKELDSPQTQSNPNAILEFLFGSKRAAVLIGQQHIRDEHQFQRLWRLLSKQFAGNIFIIPLLKVIQCRDLVDIYVTIGLASFNAFDFRLYGMNSVMRMPTNLNITVLI